MVTIVVCFLLLRQMAQENEKKGVFGESSLTKKGYVMKVSMRKWLQRVLTYFTSAGNRSFLKVCDVSIRTAQRAVGVSKAFVAVSARAVRGVGIPTLQVGQRVRNAVLHSVRYSGTQIRNVAVFVASGTALVVRKSFAWVYSSMMLASSTCSLVARTIYAALVKTMHSIGWLCLSLAQVTTHGVHKVVVGTIGVSKACVAVSASAARSVGASTLGVAQRVRNAVLHSVRYSGTQIRNVAVFIASGTALVARKSFAWVYSRMMLVSSACSLAAQTIYAAFVKTVHVIGWFFISLAQATTRGLHRVVVGTVGVSKAFVAVSASATRSVGTSIVEAGQRIQRFCSALWAGVKSIALHSVRYSATQIRNGVVFTAGGAALVVRKIFSWVYNSVMAVISACGLVVRTIYVALVTTVHSIGWLCLSLAQAITRGVKTAVHAFMACLRWLLFSRMAYALYAVLAVVTLIVVSWDEYMKQLRILAAQRVAGNSTRFEKMLAHVEVRLTTTEQQLQMVRHDVATHHEDVDKRVAAHKDNVERVVVAQKDLQNNLMQHEQAVAQKLNTHAEVTTQQLDQHAKSLNETLALQNRQLHEHMQQQESETTKKFAVHEQRVDEKLSTHEQAVEGKVAALEDSMHQNVVALDRKIKTTHKQVGDVRQAVAQVQKEQETRFDAQQKIKEAVSEQLGALREEIKRRKKEEKRKQVLSKLIDQLAEEQD
jgi:hypothetical protein